MARTRSRAAAVPTRCRAWAATTCWSPAPTSPRFGWRAAPAATRRAPGFGVGTFLGGEGQDLLDLSALVAGGPPTFVRLDGGLARVQVPDADVEDVTGSANPDQVVGNARAKRIEGRDGNDTLQAGAGEDSLFGGIGADWLQGDDGADSLAGQVGDDRLDGGSGADTVVAARATTTSRAPPTPMPSKGLALPVSSVVKRPPSLRQARN
jgi:hypothetical protein